METVGQEVGKIETRLRQLGAKLDRLVAKADEVGTDAKTDYRRRIEHVKDKQALVQSRLDAYRAANGQKWESFKVVLRLPGANSRMRTRPSSSRHSN